jgi:hypothetical protein
MADLMVVLTKDRDDEAWEIIHKLHADDNSEESEQFARAEFHQIKEQVRADSIRWAQEGNKQLFTNPSYRKRMWMGFFIQYAAQSTGAQVINSTSLPTIDLYVKRPVWFWF